MFLVYFLPLPQQRVMILANMGQGNIYTNALQEGMKKGRISRDLDARSARCMYVLQAIENHGFARIFQMFEKLVDTI